MIELSLTKGLVALIDDEDREVTKWRWQVVGDRRERAYAVRSGSGPHKTRRLIYLHRVILERKLGHEIPVGMECDHIDRDVLNNRRINLRLATRQQQTTNSRAYQDTEKSSQFKGVSWHRKAQRWSARIFVAGHSHWLGAFGDEIEAACAYNIAAIDAFGEFAAINDIPELR